MFQIKKEQVDIELLSIQLTSVLLTLVLRSIQDAALFLAAPHAMLPVEIQGYLILEADDSNIKAIQAFIVDLFDVRTFTNKELAEGKIVPEGCPHQRRAPRLECLTIDVCAIF